MNHPERGCKQLSVTVWCITRLVYRWWKRETRREQYRKTPAVHGHPRNSRRHIRGRRHVSSTNQLAPHVRMNTNPTRRPTESTGNTGSGGVP